jgi:NADPH2:quinone reductase
MILAITMTKETNMRAMRAEQFSGYGGLKLVDLPKPVVSNGKVLLRVIAVGVTPLEQRASIKSFILFAQPQAAWDDAWNTIVPLLQSGAIKPTVAKTFPLAEAADALRYLVEGRPFGRVVLTI